MTDKELQVREKQEVQNAAESTRNVNVYTPAADIYETENELVLQLDVPGVKAGGVDIDLNNDELTIHGAVDAEGEGESVLFSEYSTGDYYRKFTISQAIDREKIEARLENGVLTLTLPKAESIKPRKIAISAN